MITQEIIEQCIREGKPIPPFMTEKQKVVLALGLIIPFGIALVLTIIIIANAN